MSEEENIITDSEKRELKDLISQQGEELRKSLIDKLFSLNTILSAAFLILYQLDKNSFSIKILNILPFCTVLLILLYQLFELRTQGYAYHKIDTWNGEEDLEILNKFKKISFYIIMTSISLTLIELIYLFNILLN